MEKKGPNPVTYLFKKTWQYSEGNRLKVAIYWLMLVLSQCVNTFWAPIVYMKMMEVVTKEGLGEDSLRKLFFLLSLILVSTLLSWVFHGPARVMEQVNAFKVRTSYREYLLRGVMNLPLEWHSEHHSGDTIDKINTGTNALHNFTSNSFQIVKSFVKLIASIGVITYFSPKSALIVLVMMGLSAWITMRFDKVAGPQYRELSKHENQISESVFDSISNISTVIILRVEKLVFDSIMHRIVAPFELFKKNTHLNEWKWFSTSLCSSVMIVLVMGLYFYENRGAEKAVLVGSVYLLMGYLDNITDLFYSFISLYSDTIKSKYRVMNSEELTKDFRSQSFANHVLPEGWKTLTVEGLSFSYNGPNGALHLDDVSFSARKGEIIAVVGETGGGKTTTLKVMRDLYHPQKLKLSVDGDVIPQGFEGISRAISLVPQNPEIFATTIRENITLGAEHSDELIRRFTDMACFTEVIERLPKKLESSIKEKGVNLSGGQQQRLALSRGLLACHDKDVVLLDEPTSSLDLATEMRIYRNIFREFQGKTIISSIHRLHLLPLFHTVYMFKDGRIVGSGTVEELLESCQDFQELWQKQYL